MVSLKVAVIGPGNVGSKIGGRLLANGAAQVMYGSRDPSSPKVAKLLKSQPGAKSGTIQEAIAWSGLVLLTVPGAHTDEDVKALVELLKPAIAGKVLIDATNPVSDRGDVRWNGISSGELLAELLPGVHVFKAFNTIGANMLMAPEIDGQQLTMLFAGGPEGKGLVEQVIGGVGFIPAYVGGIRYARNLEALAELWIHLAVPGLNKTGINWGKEFNFQVISR